MLPSRTGWRSTEVFLEQLYLLSSWTILAYIAKVRGALAGVIFTYVRDKQSVCRTVLITAFTHR